jgi:hypothetical protein
MESVTGGEYFKSLEASHFLTYLKAKSDGTEVLTKLMETDSILCHLKRQLRKWP